MHCNFVTQNNSFCWLIMVFFSFIGNKKDIWVSRLCKLMEEMLSFFVSQRMNEWNIIFFSYTLFSLKDLHCKWILQVSYVMLALVAHFMHCTFTFPLFFAYLFAIFAFFFPPSQPLIFLLSLFLLLGILQITYTSFTIQWSWFITVSIWCYTVIKKSHYRVSTSYYGHHIDCLGCQGRRQRCQTVSKSSTWFIVSVITRETLNSSLYHSLPLLVV